MKYKNYGKEENFYFYDIETNGKVGIKKHKTHNKFKAKIDGDMLITSIALINRDTNEEKVFTIGLNGVNSEQDLLFAVEDIFKDKNNVLVAWNGNNFDDIIMINKLKLRKNNSCKFFDLMRGYSKFIKFKKDMNYALKDVANQVGSFKDDVNPVLAYKNRQLELLAKYNLQDVKAMVEIDKTYNIINIAREFKEIVALEDYNMLFGVTKPLESYIKKNNFKLRSNNTKAVKNAGGLNYFKNKGLYYNLKHFDVKSFYPFMMMGLEASSNLKYKELQQRFVKEHPKNLVKVDDNFYISEDGLIQCFRETKNKFIILELKGKFNLKQANCDIKQIIQPLFQYKDTAKDTYKRHAYKTLINGFYGALDSQYFKYKHPQLSAVTTFLCRYVLWNCINKFDGVYAKTDSIWTTNADLTEEELNNYSNLLLKKVGLPNPNIQWELESTVDTLVIKDKNNYIEDINGELNFKGSFPYPIQKIVLENAINNPSNIDVDAYLSRYINDVSLFCEHTNLSTKQKHHLKFNTTLSQLKGYESSWDFKNYIYCSSHGYVQSLTSDKFDLPVNKMFAKAIINNTLFDWDLLPKDKPTNRMNFNSYWKKQQNKPKFIPMYLGNGGRFVQDNRQISKMLKIKNTVKFDNNAVNNIIITNTPKFENNGLVLGDNYFAVDIDFKDFGKRVNDVKDNILMIFNKNQYVLQKTKSGGYHIIFKSNNKDISKIPLKSSNSDYEGLEFKRKAILPFNSGNYKIIKGDIDNLQNFNRIEKLSEFYGGLKEQTNLDNYAEQDDTDYKIHCDYFNELQDIIYTIAKDVKSERKEFSNALGTALKGNVSEKQANTIFKKVTEIIAPYDNNNYDGTMKYFFDNSDGSNKSYGALIKYMKEHGLSQYIKTLDKTTGNINETPTKTKNINSDSNNNNNNNKAYSWANGYNNRNGQIVKIEKDKEDEVIFNGLFYDLEVHEDVNNLVDPVYKLKVERKGLNRDLTFKGSQDDIKNGLQKHSLIFTAPNNTNIMKYLQRAFASNNGRCKHYEENLTGGYVNTEMLPKAPPSKKEFMDGWELFIEIWEQLPLIHKKCILALMVSNFKYIIISNAIGDTRLIAKAIFMYGTSNSMKTTTVDLVKQIFKITKNTKPLSSKIESPNTPVALRNMLSTNCGLVLVDDNDKIFMNENQTTFEQIIKATENIDLPF